MLSEKNYLSILKENRSFEKRQSVPERYLEDIQSEGVMPNVTADVIGSRLVISLSKHAVAVGTGVAAIVLAMAIITASYQFYKDIISKYGRKCSDFKLGSTGRRRCEIRVKVKALEERAKLLSKSVTECKKSKNPNQCANKIKQKVNQLKMKAAAAKKKLDSIKPAYEGQ